MFQKVLVNKHYSICDLKSRQKLAERRSASGHRQNEKKKPKVKHKPRTPTAAQLISCVHNCSDQYFHKTAC